MFDETVRATAIGGEAHEDPVLIDPCDSDPENLIKFVIVENRAYIRPLDPDPNSRDWLRVTETVRILGLNRNDLAEERCERMIKANGAVRRSLLLAGIAKATSDPAQRAQLLDLADSAMVEVVDYTSAQAPYAGAARAAVLEDLTAAGIVPHWSAEMTAVAILPDSLD